MKTDFWGVGGQGGGIRNGPFQSLFHFSIFVFFLEEMFLLFLGCCISFIYISLLALVSEFNF